MAKGSGTGGTGGNPLSKAAVSKLVSDLANRISDSLLPGDTPFDKDGITEAARFIVDAGAVRNPGEPAISLATVSTDRRFMRIAILNDDMPFLVDSVAQAVAAQGLSIDHLIHPVVPVRRTEDGVLKEIPEGAGAGETQESIIYIETERADARQRRQLEKALRIALGDVRAAVADWPKMQEIMAEDAGRIADGEGAALIRWLNDGMLTQLGHVTRKRDGSNSGLLGICRKSARQILADGSMERAFAWFDDPSNGSGRVPLIVKANRISNVHRRVPLDLFIIPLVSNGRVEALSIHAGVWTSAALASPPSQVPRLRTQLSTLISTFGFEATSHAGKALVHSLTILPHDLAVSFSDADLERVVATMMSLEDRPRPRLALVAAPLARHLFAFVWLPRDLQSTMVRKQIQTMLEEASDSQMLDWSLQVEGGNLAMLRFVMDIRDGDGTPDPAALEEKLQTMLRGWSEAVEVELAAGEDSARAAAIAARFADAFPQEYRAIHGPAEAALDISRLRALAARTGELSDRGNPPRDARLYCRDGDSPEQLHLKLYQLHGAMPLSDAVPALENFGFRVISEIPTSLDNGKLGTIHDFALALPEGEQAIPLFARAEAIDQAISCVLNGSAEDDAFNRLVTGTGLAAQEAEWLRAFYRYLRQIGLSYTIYTVVDALYHAPDVTRGLARLFRTLNDPAFEGDRQNVAEQCRASIREGLTRVAAINDDRLLRQYHTLVEAILRTNAFAPASQEALAFKIDSSQVPGLPKPVPWREIFVYSRRVEGIHLRAGPVARGGLRWSDRRDDFRTEILGLMKAQRVKNAVIVPTGAKGGFYPKQLPDPARNRDAWAAEGKASYQIFIRTLLSVTDNLVANKVVHPQQVVIRDGDDPYFVVAADKGTASFSDVANAIAIEEHFWLDDAFASGGSVGYDHKAMGITARGAWISVQRHFLEMGIDVQTEPVRVAGCGDMSGDVFGNGMLLSKAIKVVAAFDHRHIFLDPDPDPAASWKERKRLFDLPRSSWDDYNKSLISKGGGVFARSMKQIPLSRQIQEILGTDATELEPEALISAIITAPVDLFWFGGIGTYIKASTENNVQVGDPGNDPLRVDASAIRAKVIGEGANLGVTQAGRIEFALAGGRINTDFIDNSAGVDCSDNEVNIKIALSPLRHAGKLSDRKRVALLEDMTGQVAEIVLEDNRLQALALSIAQTGGAQALGSQARLIENLEDHGALDRSTEGLPDKESIARRAMEGIGLTRPELAVLLSTTKLVLQDAIEHSALPDDPRLVETLITSFPTQLQDKYRKALLGHRLRREIIATELCNRIINRIGIVHPFELAEEEGVDLSQVAATFVVAEDLFELPALWASLDTAKMPEQARLVLFDRLAAGVANLMSDLLRSGVGAMAPAQAIKELGKGVGQLSAAADSILAPETRQRTARFQASLVELGAPQALATQVAHLHDLDGAAGLAMLAARTGMDPIAQTRAFIDLGTRLGLDWAQGTAALMNPSDVWERMLVSGLARDFQQMRFDFLGRQENRKGRKANPEEFVASWAEDNAQAVQQFRAMVGRAQTQNPVAPAALAQLASQARNLLAR
ncbi:MAG: NAD-glutamate dehydrogenase [Sphingomonadaceae bacterium]